MEESKITELAAIYVEFINKFKKYSDLDINNWKVLCTNSAIIPSTNAAGVKVVSAAALCLSPSENSEFNRQLVKRIYESIDKTSNNTDEYISKRNESIDAMSGSLVICYYSNQTNQFFV